jgi:hypothetical protein
LGVIILTALLIFVVPFFCPWSELNCRHEEVDINSGRLRVTQYLLFCKISERVEDTALTNALPAKLLISAKPEWHYVNTFSPGVHYSPHYMFHGAIYQIGELSLIWNMYELPEPVRQKTALQVLSLWQYERSDSMAGDYIGKLAEMTANEEESRIIDMILHFEMPKIEAK